ncbi:16S rRNA (cytidine(1402)-2'-O)-methyltransferase [Candidatus Woesebacteria bacterium]|nr:16S rRNA (cytidine(1402)-2'-O)-methyltransferase [Candidatus Woesebacteria bacterium]
MLYFSGTPIGNLEDLSYRQAKVLTSSDIILAEDTRSAQNLLHAIENLLSMKSVPHQKVVSYFKDKEFERLPSILQWIDEELDICLISEAGMPLISDPGYLLLKTVIARNIPYSVIPGPSAVTTALLQAGFKNEKFMFLGFLPKKDTQLSKLLEHLKQVQVVMKDTVFVAFESPHRINETLRIMAQIIPDRQIVVTRELTKKFEQIYRGTAKELQELEYRGEITLVIS